MLRLTLEVRIIANTSPGYSLDTYDYNSFTITITHGAGYNYYHLAYRLDKPEATSISRWYTITSGERTYTITGLSPTTDYIVNVGYGTVSGGNVTWLGSSSFTTDEKPGPTIGHVNYSNAGAIQSGKPITIYASDLINFRDTIYEIYAAKGFPASPFNEDIAKGVTIKAQHINNFYFRITYLGGSFYRVLEGQPISANVFLDLRNAINSIIDHL